VLQSRPLDAINVGRVGHSTRGNCYHKVNTLTKAQRTRKRTRKRIRKLDTLDAQSRVIR